MAEQVTIKINVNADTAAISRVRAQLAALCREADDCSDTFDKYSKQLNNTSKQHKTLTNATDDHSSAVRRLSGAQKKNSKDNDSFLKQLFSMGGASGKLLDGLRSLIKFGFKYVAIEAAAAAAVIGSAGLLFKAGSALAKTYQAALSGISYGFAAIVAAASAFFATQQQFASIQFAPYFQQGLVNTKDRFESADLAMRSFTNSQELAVFGNKALSASFAELAKNVKDGKIGVATGAMRELGNVAAGMGGDIGKNFQEVSKFVAAFQKEGKLTDAVKKQGEGLSPIFKKVIEEQTKAGNTTFDKFMGTLAQNKTYADAYGGQLDAVNGTVMGRLKGAMTDIKAMLTEMGGPLLKPLGDAITKIKHMIEALLLRVRGTVTEFGSGKLLDGFVKVVEKVTLLLGRLMTHDLGQASGAFEKIKGVWESVTGFFEKIQDYLRPLQDAASVLWEALKPIVQAFMGNFNSTIQNLSKSLVKNKEGIVDFTTEVGAFLKSFGNFGTMLKDAFIKALPILTQVAHALKIVFDVLTKVFGLLNKVGGPIGGMLSLMTAGLGMRALKIGGKQLGKTVSSKIGGAMSGLPGMGGLAGGTGAVAQNVATMNVTAGVVNMATGGVPGAPAPTSPVPPISPVPPTGFRGAYGAARAGGANMFSATKAGAGSWFANSTYAPMAMMAGGTMLSSLNQSQFGNNQYVGAGANMLQTAGALKMMGASAPMAAGAATAVGAWKVGGAVSGKFFGNDDSIKGKAMGAAAGAAAGAALGSIVPGIGTAAGAVIGGLVGGISGWMSAGKNKKKAKKAAKEFIEGYQQQIDDAFKAGDIGALQGLKDNYEKMAQEAAKGNIDVYNEKIKEFAPELEKINARIDMFTSNADRMQRYLGLNTDQMNAITEATGINFQNRWVGIFEVINRAGEDFGLNLKDILGNIIADINQKQTTAILDLMDKPGEMRQMGENLNAAQAAVMSGDTSPKALEEYVKAQFEYSMGQTGGDAMKALALTQSVIQSQGGAGGALEGMTPALMGTLTSMGLAGPDAGKNLMNIASQSGQVDLLADAIMTALKGSGDTTTSLDTVKNALLNQIFTGGMGAFTAQTELLKGYGTGAVSNAQLIQSGMGGYGQLQQGAIAGMTTAGAGFSYGSGGISLTPSAPAGSVSTSTGTFTPTASTQNITVGETKITVSGILSPTEAQAIANAVAKAQQGWAFRSGQGGQGGGTPARQQ